MPLITTSPFCASHNLFLILRFSPSSWKTWHQGRLSLLFLWITSWWHVINEAILALCFSWYFIWIIFSLPRQYLDFINVSLKFTFLNFWTQGKLSGSINLKFWCSWVVMSITSVTGIYKHKQWGSLPQQCSKHFYFQSSLPLHRKSCNIKINPTISLNNSKKMTACDIQQKDYQWIQNLKWHTNHMNKTEI